MRKEYQPIFASVSRTATTSATIACESAEGLFFIDCTALTATGSIVFTIAGVSPSGTEYTILTSAAIVATGMTVLRVSPQLTAAANTIAKDMLPGALKITATAANGVAVTYSMNFVGMGG